MLKDRIQSGCPGLSGEGIIAVHESGEKGRDQFRTVAWPAGKDMVISKPTIHPYGVEGGEGECGSIFQKKRRKAT